MAVKSVQGSLDIAKKIRNRRIELKLTIEEAATKAGVGTKTWCRYEAGESIRVDKIKGVCKALNWKEIPAQNNNIDDEVFAIQKEDYEAWSSYLEMEYGEVAAASFAIGSDILLDCINDEMIELSSMPAGTHIGQIRTPWLANLLPEQFLMNYDYEFIHLLKCTLLYLRKKAKNGQNMTANSVLEEILFYICCREAEGLLELDIEYNDYMDGGYSWLWDMFEDSDLLMYLYGDRHLEEGHMYHWDNWTKRLF